MSPGLAAWRRACSARAASEPASGSSSPAPRSAKAALTRARAARLESGAGFSPTVEPARYSAVTPVPRRSSDTAAERVTLSEMP